MTHARMGRNLLAAVLALVVVGGLAGCNPFDPDLIELYVNGELRSFWVDAAKKAAAEEAIEDAVDDAVDDRRGEVVWDAWYYPAVTIEGASNVNANLGTREPVIDITGVTTSTSSVTGDKTVVANFVATWAAGNGARLTMEVNLDNAPDPIVTVSNISATVRGIATAKIVNGRSVVVVVITSATTNLSAIATASVVGISFSFSLTNQVKSAVQGVLCRELIEKAFTLRAGELYPLLDGNPPSGGGMTE